MRRRIKTSNIATCLLANKLSKDRLARQFVDKIGNVSEYNIHGTLLLNIIACKKSKKIRKLCPLLLQKGFRVDVSERDCVEIPLLEACDCGRWDTVSHMLFQETINPLVIKEALYTSLAAYEDSADCDRVIRMLIQRMGMVTPVTAPEFLKHAMIGRAWVYCLAAVAAGFTPSMVDRNRLHQVLYDSEPIESIFCYLQEIIKYHRIPFLIHVEEEKAISADSFNGYQFKKSRRKKYNKRTLFSQIKHVERILYQQTK